MRSSKLSDPVTVLFVLRYTLFLSALIASGCAYAPQSVPNHAVDKYGPGGRVLIGHAHPTILQTAHRPIGKNVVDKVVEFTFLSKGEMKFGHMPFAEAKRVRINIFGRDGALLCGSEKFEDWEGENPWWRPLSAASTIKKTCPYSDDYLLSPVRSTTEYRYETGDRENEVVAEMTVETSHYIDNDSIMCTEINSKTHKCTMLCTEIDPETHKCKSQAPIE